jgi:hypothetical protein
MLYSGWQFVDGNRDIHNEPVNFWLIFPANGHIVAQKMGHSGIQAMADCGAVKI